MHLNWYGSEPSAQYRYQIRTLMAAMQKFLCLNVPRLNRVVPKLRLVRLNIIKKTTQIVQSREEKNTKCKVNKK